MAFTAIAAVVVLLTAMLIQVGSPAVKRSSAEFSVVVTACSLVGSSPPMAQVTYAVHNEGRGTKDARLRIDYRDASGARIGSDLTRIRWVAAGILEAVKGFRRLKGYADMPTLVNALRARDRQLGLVSAEGDRHVA